MYSVILDVMGVNEFAISRAIAELSQTRTTFSQEDIAVYIGCDRKTVSRTMGKMLLAETIRRVGSNRRGYRYECVKDIRNEQ